MPLHSSSWVDLAHVVGGPEEMRAAGNFCSCPTPCETSNYVPTASFSIVMGPETRNGIEKCGNRIYIMGTETDMLKFRDQAGLEKKNVGLSLALCLAVSLGLKRLISVLVSVSEV